MQEFLDRFVFQPDTVDDAQKVMSVFDYLLMLHNDLLELEVAETMEALC